MPGLFDRFDPSTRTSEGRTKSPPLIIRLALGAYGRGVANRTSLRNHVDDYLVSKGWDPLSANDLTDLGEFADRMDSLRDAINALGGIPALAKAVLVQSAMDSLIVEFEDAGTAAWHGMIDEVTWRNWINIPAIEESVSVSQEP